MWTLPHINNMQNKNNQLRTNCSAPSHRYYRSALYKVSISSTRDPLASNLTPSKTMRTASSWNKPHHQKTVDLLKTQPLFNPKLSAQTSEVELQKPYLSTWYGLLNPEKEQESAKGLRVHLPHIIDFEPSQFTALDPLRLPIAHVQVFPIPFRKASRNLNRSCLCPKLRWLRSVPTLVRSPPR